METVRDRLWLWGHPAGSHNTGWKLPRDSEVAPAQAAEYMGIPNVIMVVYGDNPAPPFDASARELSGRKRVVWSIVGDAGSKRNNTNPDLDEVIRVSGDFPNITGAIMDDFFNPWENGEPITRCSKEQLAEFRRRLHDAPRKLDLWSVLYSHDFKLPVAEYLDYADVVTYWTWHAKEIAQLEDNFATMESLLPHQKKALGCYMWDYGPCEEMPVEAMERQCELGLRWLKQGRIDGMVFLASCVCDIGLPAVEWTREWIAKVGDERV